VALALVYLVLAIREHIACWPAAIISAGIYLVLMYQAGLYMISALQLFYIGMAFYGWYSWRHGAGQGRKLRVSSWPPRNHIPVLSLILAAMMANGFVLTRFTDAAMPYLDSLITWGAIVSTWMVARKILENWYYWFIIDSISVYVYLDRGLYLTALLFVLYLVLIMIGLRQWRRSLDAAPA